LRLYYLEDMRKFMEKESIVLRYRIRRGVKEEMPYRGGGGLELSYRKLSYVFHRVGQQFEEFASTRKRRLSRTNIGPGRGAKKKV